MFLTHEPPENGHAEFAPRSTMSRIANFPPVFGRLADALGAFGPGRFLRAPVKSEAIKATFVDIQARPARRDGDGLGLLPGGDL